MGDLRLLGPEEQKGSNKSYFLHANPFPVLTAVEVLLRTLAKAGTYYVDDPQDDRSQSEKRPSQKY